MPPAWAAPATVTPDPSRGAAAKTRSVTLITGDRVVVTDGAKTGLVTPGPGRRSMSFSTTYTGGHLYVVPRDAVRAVAEGRLDRRLFDVTALVEFGYDDAKTDGIPLLVQRPAGQTRATAFAAPGVSVTRQLPAVRGTAVRAKKSSALWKALSRGGAQAPTAQTMTDAGVGKVWLDGKRSLNLDRSIAQIGAPTAWKAGFTGAGVKVAVLDTGVDGAHPDLAGRETAERNFTDAPDNTDDVGHGTHVAATIASTGVKARGKYKGVAPGVSLLDGKVCTMDDCAESAILAGMEWAATQGADVVNMSLGGPDTPEVDPVEEALNTLSAKHNTLFVVAAGNSGPRSRTVGSPGSADAALTVGAIDRDESLADFSSRGPRVGDFGIKPDITAPGVEIVAAKSAAGVLGTPVEDGYVSMSGTSMATPHVAGAAAILAQQHPDWTGAQLKAALTTSARPNQDLNVFQQGSGRVDVAKAITQTVTTEPTSVSLGVQQWPHQDDQPVSKPVSYRNTGAASVTLSLSVRAAGPDDKPAPAGMFTVSPAQVVVPAGSEVKATVTVDTRRGSVDGIFTGALVATAGNTAVRTPVTVNREVESYDLTVGHLDRTGAAASVYGTLLVGMDNDTDVFLADPSGTDTIRVPKGRYVLHSDIYTEGSDGKLRPTLLTQPLLVVNAKRTVTMDSRVAKPVNIAAPDPGAKQQLLSQVVFSRKWGAEGELNTGEIAFNDDKMSDIWTAHLGPAVPARELTALVSTTWTNWKRGPEPAIDPKVYGLAWSQSGRVYTGFDGAVPPKRRAEVKVHIGPAPAGHVAQHGMTPVGRNNGEFWGTSVMTTTPATVTYHLGGQGTRWLSNFGQDDRESTDPNSETWQTSPPKSYQPGRRYQERVNFGVFGPALPANTRGGLQRRGNQIGADVPLFGDSSGSAGFSQVTAARTALWRNGELMGDLDKRGGVFSVPAAGGAYRLVMEATRAGVSDVSSQVSGAWTFRSAYVDATTVVELPASVIRFNPKLDDNNAAPAGGAFRIPVSVQSQGGAGSIRQVAVEVSYDDGKTWQKAPVVDGTARVLHPAEAGFVSLRAKATDSNGNTVEQTIIRAYKLVAR